MYKDLNSFIAALDKDRELARIQDPVSPVLEPVQTPATQVWLPVQAGTQQGGCWPPAQRQTPFWHVVPAAVQAGTQHGG